MFRRIIPMSNDDSSEGAIKIIDSSQYGLAVAVLTQDIDLAVRRSRELGPATLWVADT